MEVGRMPISASHRAKLISAGYSTLSSLSSLSSSDLARDLKISDNEAAEILKVASHSRRLDESAGGRAIVDGAQTAWDMLHEEEMFPLITTSSIDLDNILGGGINSKEVTEIEDLTECNSLLRKDFQAGQLKMHPNNILENIFYFCICSYTKQIALTNYLDKFISEHKDVKIVVVDSITFHFRQDFDDMALRTRLLSGMALKLMKLTKEYSLAVVLMNQVTTKHIEGSFQLTLALGE